MGFFPHHAYGNMLHAAELQHVATVIIMGLIAQTGLDMQATTVQVTVQACYAGASYAEATIGYGREGWH